MEGVLVVGGGIGGLTLALCLQRHRIPCQVVEAAAEVKPLGVGVDIPPRATAVLARLGLDEALLRHGVPVDEAHLFNRFGQLVHREPLGRAAGHDHPQISIHRADLHGVLLAALRERLGKGAVLLDRRVARVEQDEDGVTIHFTPGRGGAIPEPLRGSAAIGADGIHSVLRRQFYPNEGDPSGTGRTMWRGVSRWTPILAGAGMVRIGRIRTGAMAICPVRNEAHGEGRQLINWVFEVETDSHRARRDWNRPGDVEDVIPHVRDWVFDWLDLPAMLRASDVVLEFPVTEQELLPRWSFGRAALLGDAAHPMAPRGPNGVAPAILDAECLADRLAGHPDDPESALKAYEAVRLPAAARLVQANFKAPPDAILAEVAARTGDRPFTRIEDVISREELLAITGGDKRMAGYDPETLKARA